MQVDYMLHFVHVQYSCGGVLHNNCAFIYLCVVLHCTGWVCLALCCRPATRWELTAEGALTQQTPWDYQRWLWKGASCLVYNVVLLSSLCVFVSTHSLPLSLHTQHCLAGWENAQPSVILPQSKVDLKSAVKSTVRSVLSPAYMYWPNMPVVIGRSQKLWCGCELQPNHTHPILIAWGGI